ARPGARVPATRSSPLAGLRIVGTRVPPPPFTRSPGVRYGAPINPRGTLDGGHRGRAGEAEGPGGGLAVDRPAHRARGDVRLRLLRGLHPVGEWAERRAGAAHPEGATGGADPRPQEQGDRPLGPAHG